MTPTHLPYDVLKERLLALAPAPRDEGTVSLVVCRPAVDARVTPAKARLSPEGGLEGDRWAARANPTGRGGQISVIRADVARVMANGQSPALFGDNLLLELDLSTKNLPTLTKLRVGTAVCQVTSKPHTGCSKLAARFGQAARELAGDAALVEWRLRGVFFEVLEAGEVAPGDGVSVISRPG